MLYYDIQDYLEDVNYVLLLASLSTTITELRERLSLAMNSAYDAAIQQGKRYEWNTNNYWNTGETSYRIAAQNNQVLMECNVASAHVFDAFRMSTYAVSYPYNLDYARHLVAREYDA